MSASQTLESYIASFKRQKRSSLAVPMRVYRPRVEQTVISIGSSIDTEALLRSDTSELVKQEVKRVRERSKHRKNVHSMPLAVIQENNELRARPGYNIHDYLPGSSGFSYMRVERPRQMPARLGRRVTAVPMDKQSTVSSVDTEALLQSSDDEIDEENFPISKLTKELLEQRTMESISPRYNPVVSISNTSRASPLPGPMISPSPDLTSHVRTMSVPLARARKLSEPAAVMVENNRQVLLCPSQRSEEKASLESTLQKCLGAQSSLFQGQRDLPATVTPKFNNKRSLPFVRRQSEARPSENEGRPSAASDQSEALEGVNPRPKQHKTYVKLKICTCILAGILGTHKPGCKVTTVTALLPTKDSPNSSSGSLCNLKSGTTHSHFHSTHSGSNSLIEDTKPRRRLSLLEAIIVIQRQVRKFLLRLRKQPLPRITEESLAYSRSTNDRSNCDIDKATKSIRTAIGFLRGLKSPPVCETTDLLSLDELEPEGLNASEDQLGKLMRPDDLHEAKTSLSELLQRESGETLWIDVSSTSIDPLGSKELAL